MRVSDTEGILFDVYHTMQITVLIIIVFLIILLLCVCVCVCVCARLLFG